jgi:hypothetical protein
MPLPDPGPDTRAPVGSGDGGTYINNAKFNDGSQTNGSSDVKVESLMPEELYLGQIVPFEIKITVTGLESPENGNIRFTAGWSTESTSGDAFGYDPAYGVIAAFVDTGDGAHIDTNGDGHGDAEVSSFEWSMVKNKFGVEDEFQGVFDVTGLDSGDEVVVEVWVVIQKTFPEEKATGNVHSRLIDAISSPGEDQEDVINTGTQTVPMKPFGPDPNGGFMATDELAILSLSSVADVYCQ